MTEPGAYQCHDLEARLGALREILGEARQEVLFYAPRLDAKLIEDATVQHRLQDFLLASPRHGLRILVVDGAVLVRDCPRLMTLCQRLPSRCQLRVTGTNSEPLDEALYCVDRHHALHRPPTERTVHLHLANQPMKVDPLRQRVEELWRHGRETPEFRQLTI